MAAELVELARMYGDARGALGLAEAERDALRLECAEWREGHRRMEDLPENVPYDPEAETAPPAGCPNCAEMENNFAAIVHQADADIAAARMQAEADARLLAAYRNKMAQFEAHFKTQLEAEIVRSRDAANHNAALIEKLRAEIKAAGAAAMMNESRRAEAEASRAEADARRDEAVRRRDDAERSLQQWRAEWEREIDLSNKERAATAGMLEKSEASRVVLASANESLQTALQTNIEMVHRLNGTIRRMKRQLAAPAAAAAKTAKKAPRKAVKAKPKAKPVPARPAKAGKPAGAARRREQRRREPNRVPLKTVAADDRRETA